MNHITKQGKDPKWLRIWEAAERKRCSVKTIRRMITAGTIEANRFGTRIILVDAESLDRAGLPLQWTE